MFAIKKFSIFAKIYFKIKSIAGNHLSFGFMILFLISLVRRLCVYCVRTPYTSTARHLSEKTDIVEKAMTLQYL
jgi:hypothetical protein